MLATAANGKWRKLDDVNFADSIIMARKKGIWEVIEKLMKRWIETAPDEVKAIKVNIDEYKAMTIDKKFGQTLGGKQMERRFILAFPETLMFWIRTQYTVEELPFDRKFYTEFAKRYPQFRVAEKM